MPPLARLPSRNQYAPEVITPQSRAVGGPGQGRRQGEPCGQAGYRQIRKPKPEIRRKPEGRNPINRMPIVTAAEACFELRYSDFALPSGLGFRPSDLTSTLGQRLVHPPNGFVNLSGALEADDHSIQLSPAHGEADGFLAVFLFGEVAVADDLHGDDAVAFGTHGLQLPQHG